MLFRSVSQSRYNPLHSFDEWVRSRTYIYQNPVDRWNKHTGNLLEIAPRINAYVVMMDALFDNPVELINRISEHFKLGNKLKLADSVNLKQARKNAIKDDGVFSYAEETKLLISNLLDKHLMYKVGFVTDLETADQIYPFAHRRAEFEAAAAVRSEYPKEQFNGKGIVIAAGGEKYFTNAYVCVSMLRKLGCTLPIQIWYLGAAEMTEDMKKLMSHLDVQFVDAHEERKIYPASWLS